MKNRQIGRREFLRRLGIGTSSAGLALAGCGTPGKKTAAADLATGEIPTDRMTYRANPKTGEKVSLLGYGCMRWPTTDGGSGRDADSGIDQEAVNDLVDTA
ncbi:MAG: aldo/keto reductase, partial [Muribaculaceae bacterium]|nr:aldo/keto reductase [Muribaculaceae bacterium]